MSTGRRGQTPSVRSFAPRFDVRETSDASLLDGELAGIAQNDIDIEFSDSDTLKEKESTEMVKSGDKQVSKNDNRKHRYWDSVKASLKNGILSIVVPKRIVNTSSKKIAIE
ncbi:hypothetical protein KXW14_008909 [Aspergillus fumigatus]|nr:hypothetical protein KXV80_000954 [Aspergillus fumigatus]KAH2240304.1 hypothetical protein KXW14_008909 [Aspergillus fumigatus]KAH2737393.1 hypothetical protein KXV39_008202 [Aspergillus fumigatus]KAH2963161.1 hypothetical protein KXW43_002146 [Aspergillus fumigatus]